jgi:hypothetical protein
MLEKLLQLTNSTDFWDNWAFFLTEISLPARSTTLRVKLEAIYDGFDEQHFDKVKIWELLCNNYAAHHLELGYLRPFYQMKICEEHPLLSNHQSDFYLLKVNGYCSDPLALSDELFAVHYQATGGWPDFVERFGYLHKTAKEEINDEFQLPEPLVSIYSPVFQKYGLCTSWKMHYESNEEFKVLLFSGENYPDNINRGQYYIVAGEFDLLNSA